MKRHLAALVFVLEVTVPGAVPAQVIERDVAIVTRDGVKLAADVIRPAGAGPFPTLVYRTPYSRRGTFEGGTVRAAVGRGYAVVVQDVRGRYGSAGEFVPYLNEGKDGYDTIEWAAAQPWSNGKVGTFGLSYPGAVQWLAAVESPPHLAAMVPAMTFSTSRNFIYSGGVFDGSWTTWTWNNIAPDVRVRKNLPGPRTGEAARAAWDEQRDSVQKRLPLTNLPEFKDVAPWLTQWMLVPPGDARWDWMEIRGKYDKVKAAVLNISGWHDEAYGPEGAITNYLGLLQSRRGQDPRTTLVLGPWIHGGPMSRDSKRQESSGDRSFGPAAAHRLRRAGARLHGPLSQARAIHCRTGAGAGAGVRDGGERLARRAVVAAAVLGGAAAALPLRRSQRGAQWQACAGERGRFAREQVRVRSDEPGRRSVRP